MVSWLLPGRRRAGDRTTPLPRRRVGGNPWIARFLAPTAFLLAVTGVVLLVRPALRSNHATRSTATVRTATRAHAPRPAPHPVTPKRYYVITSGDTLGAIASRFATTVDELLRLNPGIRPTTLHPGDQLRIR